MMFGSLMGLGMWFVWGIPLALLIGGGAVVARLFTNPSALQAKSLRNPRQILDARLASGEIACEEYDTLRSRLGPKGVTQ